MCAYADVFADVLAGEEEIEGGRGDYDFCGRWEGLARLMHVRRRSALGGWGKEDHEHAKRRNRMTNLYWGRALRR